MKNLRRLLLVLVLLMGLTTVVYASIDDIQIVLDGEILEMDTRPEIVDGRTNVPVRFVSESLGFEVEWSQKDWLATITNPKAEKDQAEVIYLEPGKDIAKVKYKDQEEVKEVKLDVGAYLKDSRTMVPLRFVGETMGIAVDWDQENWTVILGDKAKYDPQPIKDLRAKKAEEETKKEEVKEEEVKETADNKYDFMKYVEYVNDKYFHIKTKAGNKKTQGKVFFGFNEEKYDGRDEMLEIFKHNFDKNGFMYYAPKFLDFETTPYLYVTQLNTNKEIKKAKEGEEVDVKNPSIYIRFTWDEDHQYLILLEEPRFEDFANLIEGLANIEKDSDKALDKLGFPYQKLEKGAGDLF